MNSYFENRAQDYFEKSNKGIWSWFKNKELQTVESLLLPDLGKSLVEFGCGAGFYGGYFKSKYNLKVLGIDNSPSMLAAANLRGIETKKVNLEDSFDLGLFDYALGIGVLEFVEKPEVVFENFSRSVVNDGKLVILFPPTGLVGLIYKKYHEWFGCSVYLRTPAFYTELARQNGFKKIAEKKATLISRVICFAKVQ